VRAVAPSISAAAAAELVDDLESRAAMLIEGGTPTDEAVSLIVADHGLQAHAPDPVALRRAVALPFDRGHAPLPGALELVRSLHALGWRLVVVSNTLFRDAVSYRGDFDAAGIGDCIDGIVTSVDLGARKPDPALVRTALDLARTEARRAVMVGNSEESDVLPARALGLATVRVAIEQPAPAASAADAVVTSLDDALAAVVRVAAHR